MLLHFQRVPVRGLPVGNKCGSRSRAGYVTIIIPMAMNVVTDQGQDTLQ